jgi:hypothetical protein
MESTPAQSVTAETQKRDTAGDRHDGRHDEPRETLGPQASLEALDQFARVIGVRVDNQRPNRTSQRVSTRSVCPCANGDSTMTNC